MYFVKFFTIITTIQITSFLLYSYSKNLKRKSKAFQPCLYFIINLSNVDCLQSSVFRHYK